MRESYRENFISQKGTGLLEMLAQYFSMQAIYKLFFLIWKQTSMVVQILFNKDGTSISKIYCIESNDMPDNISEVKYKVTTLYLTSN